MQSFFILFDLEERFNIDIDELDMRYFALQSQHHPDRSSEINMGLLINQGYKILKDNFERASHILELHNIFIKDDKLAPKLPPEKLENILDIIENRNEADPIPDILGSITQAFEDKDYTKAAMHVLELRYLEKGML